MASMFKSLTQGWADLFRGAGYVMPPQPGNTANAPGDPAVVTGNYEFIQWQMWDGAGVRSSIASVPHIPVWGMDWGQYGVNVAGLSGDFGGGSTGDVPQPGPGGSLYYDDTTGQYIDLSLLSVKGG